MRKTLLLACLLAVAAMGAETWTPEVALKVRAVASVVPSPDGKLVVYTENWAVMDGEKSEFLTHIFLARADGSSRFQLTRGEKSSTAPQWSPDGRWITFLSSRAGKNDLWRIPADGGEAERLTELKVDIGNYKISPDGKQIAYLAPDPESPEKEKSKKEKRDFQVVDKEPARGRLWLMPFEADAKGKREPRKLVGGDYHIVQIQWSPDAAHIAFEQQPTPKADDWTKMDISEATVADGTVKAIAATAAAESDPLYSRDGRHLAYTRTKVPVRWATERRIVLRTGTSERELPATFDEQPSMLGWSADSRQIFFGEGKRTHRVLYAMPLDGPPATIAEGAEGFWGFAELNAAGTHLGVTRQSPAQPVEAFVMEARRGAAPVQVSRANTHLPAFPALETKAIRWKSADGLEIEGLLTLPLGYEKSRRYALLLNIHGGPTGVFVESFIGGPGIYPLATFAERGYAILRANIRGSSSYGRAFRFANYNDWGGKDYQDLMSGVDHVIQMGVADPNRLTVSGWSYGGFMTSWVITQTKRFKAAAVGAGVTNLFSFTGTSDIPGFLPDYFSGEPWENLAAYEKHSAMFNVKGVATPTLILHGEQDLRVPISQGYELYNALKRQGVTTEMVVYPRMPHGPREPKFQIDLMQRHLEWMDRYVKGGG